MFGQLIRLRPSSEAEQLLDELGYTRRYLQYDQSRPWDNYLVDLTNKVYTRYKKGRHTPYSLVRLKHFEEANLIVDPEVRAVFLDTVTRAKNKSKPKIL